MPVIREHSPLAPSRTRRVPDRYAMRGGGPTAMLLCGVCGRFFPWGTGVFACPSCIARKERGPSSVEVIEHDGEPD